MCTVKPNRRYASLAYPCTDPCPIYTPKITWPKYIFEILKKPSCESVNISNQSFLFGLALVLGFYRQTYEFRGEDPSQFESSWKSDIWYMAEHIPVSILCFDFYEHIQTIQIRPVYDIDLLDIFKFRCIHLSLVSVDFVSGSKKCYVCLYVLLNMPGINIKQIIISQPILILLFSLYVFEIF